MDEIQAEQQGMKRSQGPTQEEPVRKRSFRRGSKPTKGKHEKLRNLEAIVPDGVHLDFAKWAMSRGVIFDDEITPAQLPGRGMGLKTTTNIRSGKRIIFVPSQAMFTPVKMMMDKDEKFSDLSPQARLTVSALGNIDFLRQWIATWPTKDDVEECMPLCWDAVLSDSLPPAAKHVLSRQQVDIAADWAASKGWCEEYSHSYEDFRYFWLIVNSRSFHWKPQAQSGGEYAMCPFLDYMNHTPTGSGCEVLQTSKGYEVWTNQDHQPGQEILATYGAHSNDKLLVHYGFIPSNNNNNDDDDDSPQPSPDDGIRLDDLLLPAIPQNTQSQLLDTGYLGSYFLSPSDNSLCHRTQVAARAALLACNEWEYFVTNGDDLGDDASAKVEVWLLPLFRKGVEIAEQKANEAREGTGNEVARALLAERWGQISGALQGWIDWVRGD
ncbi:hypothetical protein MBLNU230_g6878t1 [Neophaeotheca triangularis]